MCHALPFVNLHRDSMETKQIMSFNNRWPFARELRAFRHTHQGYWGGYLNIIWLPHALTAATDMSSRQDRPKATLFGTALCVVRAFWSPLCVI